MEPDVYQPPVSARSAKPAARFRIARRPGGKTSVLFRVLARLLAVLVLGLAPERVWAQCFQSPSSIAVWQPSAGAAGDFNKDGKTDLAITTPGGLTLLPGNGNGTFADGVTLTAGFSAAVADYDGDGNPDLATADAGGKTVKVLLGNGEGTFDTAVPYTVAETPNAVTAADFNGDTHPDLAAITSANGVAVLLNNGDGTFGTPTHYGVGYLPNTGAFSVGDFNGDGKPDLVTAHVDNSEGSNNVSVLTNNGDGTFGSPTVITPGGYVSSVAAGDFNRDAKADLVITTYSSQNRFVVYLSNGDGTFRADYTSGTPSPFAATLADFNNDGILDLANTQYFMYKAEVRLGRSTGAGGYEVSFGSSAQINVGTYPQYITVGDFNGDTKPDLIVSNTHSRDNTMTVALNGATATFTAPDAALCAGQSVGLDTLVSGFSPTGGTLSFHASLADAKANANPLPSTTVSPAADGSYFVRYQTTGQCGTTTIEEVKVTVHPYPTAFALTGGGGYCTGGNGVAVGLADSETGVSYQLRRGGTAVGEPLTGTGEPLSFGNQTEAGTYTVVATRADRCAVAMTGSAVVSVNPLPAAFDVTGGGDFCAGGAGVAVGLADSETGVSYQLRRDGTNVGSPVVGTGNALSFGNQTAAGTYTVVATTAASCGATMTGSATVGVNALPVPVVSAGGPTAFCPGGSVNLSTDTYANYAWKKGGTAVGTNANAHTANATGSYTVTVTDANGCQGTSAPLAVTVHALPLVTATTNAPCLGGDLALTATVGGGGTAPLSYDWSGPNGYDPGPTATNPLTRSGATDQFAGTYSVTVTDGNGCQGSGQTGAVGFEPGPLPKPSVAADACAGQRLTVTFSFSGCPSAYGTLTLQLSDKNGDFASPAAAWSASPGSHSLSLPLGLPASTLYRVRLVSSSPALTSEPSRAFSIAVPVVGLPTIPGQACKGQLLPVAFSTAGGCAFPEGNAFTVQLSSATGSFSNPTVLSTNATPGTTPFTLPANLPAGSGYRVRVLSSNPAQTSAASAPFQLEGPSLSVTPTVGGAPVCRGSQVTLGFNLPNGSCPFPNGNTFTAQLSSATGSFNNPTSLGTVSSGGGQVTVPASVAAGSGYRIRVVSSSPALTSANSSPFQVKACASRLSAEEPALVVSPNPVVGGNAFPGEIRLRVKGMDNPQFSLTTTAGGSVNPAVKTVGSGEWVLTPKQRLAPGVYALQAREGTTVLTTRVLVVE